MDNDSDLEQFVRKLNRERRVKLLNLLTKILGGEFNSSSEPIDSTFSAQQIPRATYESPLERSTNNYGYTTSLEIGEHA